MKPKKPTPTRKSPKPTMGRTPKPGYSDGGMTGKKPGKIKRGC